MGLATVWEFIPLTEYHPPQPSSSALGLDLVSRKSARTGGSSEPKARERSLPWHDTWIRPIDWKPAASAFDGVLDAWSNDSARKGSAQVSVGSLGSAEQVLRAWAAQRSVKVLEPPTIDALFDGNAEVWPVLQGGSKDVLVIPALERCFIRHHKGLRLVRQLIEATRVTPHRLVIGCDIWAWKFLQTALQFDVLCSNPVTIAPLDSTRLRAWVPTLTAENRDVRFVVDGEDCFAPDSESGEQLLCELAATSRGVPTLAWSLWRSLLQESVRKPAGNAVEFHLAVSTASPFSLQGAIDSRIASYVLHTILLHGGLPDGALPRLLPFVPSQIWKALLELRDQGLVTEEEGLWRVVVKYYAEICRRLAAEGFWIADV